MNRTIYLLLIVACCSCSSNTGTEKHQSKRNNVIHVKERVKEIEIEEVLINAHSPLYLISDYLIILDHQSSDKLIHILHKNDYRYITSAINKGEGPGEIVNIGHIEPNEKERLFYVSDHGKQRIFSYELDSILVNPSYMPKEKMKMREGLFPGRYTYVNDTLCIGSIIEPIPYVGFAQTTAKLNMTTGEIKSIPYSHPEIERKRVWNAVSVEHGIIVECYSYHDLITICNLNGELIYNIYGQHWNNRTSNHTRYFGKVVLCGDRIITTYLGGDTFIEDSSGVRSNNPTQLMVFNIHGDYVQTLETGYMISNFCYDEDNHRIVLNLNDEIQFGYLDLNGIL